MRYSVASHSRILTVAGVDRCVRVVRPGDVGAFCAFLHSPGRALPVIAITERRSNPVMPRNWLFGFWAVRTS